ncbi:MAG TPA: hypothetical protein VIE65_21285 [Methylobacter sp.]
MQRQLLLTSLGFGVYIGELVPSVLVQQSLSETISRDSLEISANDMAFNIIREMIQKSEIGEILDVIQDPGSFGRAYIILKSGLIPCKFELDLMTEAEHQKITQAANLADSAVLSSRILMIDAEMAKTGSTRQAQ